VIDLAATLGQSDAGSLSAHFVWLDWLVMVGYLALVSVIGIKLGGKQTSMADFFRGGDRLPWYAVSGSMIATIISAVTFVGVPSVAFAPGGNFTYLQLGIIAGLLSRLFVAFILVPAYYKRRVYSPYDYMGRQLGEAARSVTTALFSLMGLLAQAARVYLTAVILELVLRDQLGALEAVTGIDSLVWSVSLVGLIAVAWTMLGGITTVVWTDVMLFLVFITGGIVAIAVIVAQLPGGLGQLIADGAEAGKFQLWSLGGDTDGNFASFWGEVFAEPFTIWAAVFAVALGNIGAYGTDQLLAQRIFCCKTKRDAQLAVVSSYIAELVAAMMLLVGVGLWVYYQQFPERLVGEGAAAVAEKTDNIFPVFILTQVPVGLSGLIVAGIFAAAISSMTSILAALAQTTVSAVYLPLRGIDPDGPTTDEQNRRIVRISRYLVAGWGVGLCLIAFAIDRYVDAMKAGGEEVLFLNLALGLASYVIGALFATFMLAWLPLKRNAYGLIWSAPLSVFTVFAARFHEDWSHVICWAVAGVLTGSWLIAAAVGPRCRAKLLRTPWLLVGCGLMMLVNYHLVFARTDGSPPVSIAWPWYAPIGAAMAFAFGYLLALPRQPRGDATT